MQTTIGDRAARFRAEYDNLTIKRDAYAEAGVDIAAGNLFVDRIRPMVARTVRAGFEGGIGGFGGVFDLKACGFDDPLLVAATDGVGTKLLLGIEADRLEPLGQDLVAMCVNDLVVQGATPLFFLDYMATGKLEPGQMARLVDGITRALAACNCALVGGETAEMPGLYRSGHFDLAGFAVGAVERNAMLPRSDIKCGDAIIGLASSGLHSNGFSLVRRILGTSGLTLGDPAPFDDARSMADVLLEPTRLYVTTCLDLVSSGWIKALAHITGGGLTENVPRILPSHLAARLDATSWQLPPLQAWLADQGQLDRASLYRTFNCGIGMAIIVDQIETDDILEHLTSHGEQACVVGEVVEAENGPVCRIEG